MVKNQTYLNKVNYSGFFSYKLLNIDDIIQVENRKGLYDYLRLNNIFCQVHYIPVHTMPYYEAQGYKKGSMPISEKYYEHCLSLPMFPTLTFEEQNFVIKTIAFRLALKYKAIYC